MSRSVAPRKDVTPWCPEMSALGRSTKDDVSRSAMAPGPTCLWGTLKLLAIYAAVTPQFGLDRQRQGEQGVVLVPAEQDRVALVLQRNPLQLAGLRVQHSRRREPRVVRDHEHR